MNRIILTGGGTAGHVTPNIALLSRLRALEMEIHYIGSRGGMERALIEAEKVSYHPVQAGKLRRYLDLRNLTDLFRISAGFFQSLIIISRLKPTIVFSKGGFVSCPVVWAAWVCRVPVVLHESDMTPGLANRLCLPFASRVCFSFPETAKYLPSTKARLTGIPVRDALLVGDKFRGRAVCGFTGEKPCVLLIGGSQGAMVINAALRKVLDEVLARYDLIHICGRGNTDPALNRPGYRQFEYVTTELPDLFALADVVVSRAGATTLFELLALRKPNLLIPLSLRASRGDQIDNAHSFVRLGFSRVLTEEQLTAKSLREKIDQTYEDRERLTGEMLKTGVENSADAVIDVISELVPIRKNTNHDVPR